jgi:DmX-like protein
VVSIQSTARPGCIIELEKLVDSNGKWTKADLFHIYQEGLICKSEPNSNTKKFNQQFYENYFLVLLENKKTSASSSSVEKVHMWKVTISSAPLIPDEPNQQQSFYSTTNSHLSDTIIREGNVKEATPNNINNLKSSFSFEKTSLTQKNRLSITSTRVCTQDLILPESVHVVCADSAAADLSSSAMFTLSKVPYLFSTACSDGVIRFWSCKKVENSDEERFEFFEWKLNSTILSSSPFDIENFKNNISQIKIESYPLAISCSYNSRFAVAYKKNQSSTTATSTTTTTPSILENENLTDNSQREKQTFTNFCVDIYECESTGGSEWKLEDRIYLKNIILPELDSGINFDYIFGNHKPIRPARSCHSFKSIVFNSNNNNNVTSNSGQMSANGGASNSSSSNNAIPSTLPVNMNINEASKIPEIPSSAAIISIKRKYAFEKNFSKSHDSNDFTAKSHMGSNGNLVKLDWASTENGSHILTVGLGNQIFIYSCITKELDKLKNAKSITSFSSTSTKKNDADFVKSNVNTNSLVKWTQFRSFQLDSADDMQALPSEIKWVREGLLIVGLNTEMQIFSQWSSLNQEIDFNDKNNDNMAKSFEYKSLMKVPKNHSVLDLNKLSKLTNETSKFNKTRKHDEDNESFDLEMNKSKRNSLKKFENDEEISNKKTRVFDENQMLEIIQDSGLFMQTK